MTIEEPEFKVIAKAKATSKMKPRRARRNWAPLIDAICAGRTIFVSSEDVNEADRKYLDVALKRRGKGERLRTQRVIEGGVEGRYLWVEVDPNGRS